MPPFVVSQATVPEFLPACRLLFPDGSAEQRGHRILGDPHPTGLFVARDANWRLHAAALVQVVPGALGVAWAPRGDSAEAVDAVTAAACAWLREHGVKVCQAFAPASEAADMAPLEGSGFRHVTQLVFLRRKVDRERDRPRPVDWIDGAYYLPALKDVFAATLLATHAGTLDCPELNGHRTDAELVAGYELPDRASSWHFRAESAGRLVGVVTTNPADSALELTYLGVVPAERGRGFGDKLVQFVLHAAAVAFDSLTLSVDARNTPAMKLYTRHAFVEYDRREVWLAQFHEPEA